MKFLKPGLYAILLSAAYLLGGVELSNSINDVYFRGDHELAGSVTMRINDNDFPNASSVDAVFFRGVLDHGAVLSHTLVDLTSDDPTVGQPIFLAMRLHPGGGNAALNAPPNSVSIVRWVRGESQFWVRVQSSSSTWVIEDGGEPGPPSDDLGVSWTIGVSARQSAGHQSQLPANQVNLPFNTRDLQAGPDDFADAVTVFICLDLSEGNLSTVGVESLVNGDLLAFDQSAQVEPGVYRPGVDLGFFINEFTIARGKERACQVSLLQLLPFDTCIEETSTPPGFVTIKEQLHLRIDCESGGSVLETNLFNGSTMVLTTPDGTSFGFGDELPFFFGDAVMGGEVTLADPFEAGDRTLYRTAIMVWNDGFRVLNNGRLLIDATLHSPTINGPQNYALNWTLNLVNHDGALDLPPFDLPGQERRCKPSPYLAGQDLWEFKNTACRFGSERIIPHVTRDVGGFSTDLIIANTGPQPGDYILTAYDAAGNQLGQATATLAGDQTTAGSAQEILGLEDAGYLSISGDEMIRVSAVYRAAREDAGPVHLTDFARQARKWRIYPGNPSITWDGIATVNTGVGPTPITVFQKTYDGAVIDQRTVAGQLESGEKLLYLFFDQFAYQPNTYFDVVAGNPIALIALRGNLNSDFLWENKALPLPE